MSLPNYGKSMNPNKGRGHHMHNIYVSLYTVVAFKPVYLILFTHRTQTNPGFMNLFMKHLQLKSVFFGILLPVLLVTGIGCKTQKKVTTSEDIKNQKNIALEGNAYLFAPEFNQKTCQSSGSCDCCASHVLFVDDKNFVTVIYCVPDEQIFSGTYQWKGNKVHLQYNTSEIDLVYQMSGPSGKSGNNKQNYVVKTKKSDANLIVLNAQTCGGQNYFTISGDEISYGTADKKVPLKKHIQRLKDVGVWQKIKF